MDRTFVFAFVAIFVVLILFVSLNTIMGEYVFPIFDDIAQNTSFINQSTYPSQSSFFQNVFLTAFFILLIIPFLYILVKVLRKEPEPAYYPGPYGEGY